MNDNITTAREPTVRASACPPEPQAQIPLVLKVEGLSKTFCLGRGVVPVLKDVTFHVRAGETVSIIGASGAGKTTLLHIIGGLDHPTSGSVIFDGQDMYKLSARKRTLMRARRIGFVFQFYYLLPELDVLENVMLPTMNWRACTRASRHAGLFRGSRKDTIGSKPDSVAYETGPRDADRAMALLKTVGLADRAGHLPAELSGGEHQRASLVRALMNEPDLLLADEPTGNLDSVMGDAVLDSMCALSREKGSTLILVTHNPAVAGRCDRVLKLEDGCLASC